MKHLKLIFLTLFLVAGYLALRAQDNSQRQQIDRNNWRASKISFLTDKLQLTPAEAQKFWPVYNEFDRLRWEAQRARRDLENKLRSSKDKLSDKEMIQLTRDYSGSLQKESDLLIKYNEEFLKILPPEKVLTLYQAENDWMRFQLNRFRERGDRRTNQQ